MTTSFTSRGLSWPQSPAAGGTVSMVTSDPAVTAGHLGSWTSQMRLWPRPVSDGHITLERRS